MKFSKNYFLAIATLVGTTIGAGIFALPILVYSSGVLPFLLILSGLLGLQYLFNKMYASVILSTKSEHRLPGYVDIYFGKKYKKITSFPILVGSYGSLLAYLMLGGIFSYELFHGVFGGTIFFYTLVVFFLEAIVVLLGLKMIAKAELIMSFLLIIVAAMVSWRCFTNTDFSNYSLGNWGYLPLLYGPVFFSIGGSIAIPEVCKILNKEKEKIKNAILLGTIISGVVTAIFVIAVIGATGKLTTPDSLIGLNRVLDGRVIYLALLFGLLNVATSFFTSLQAVREVYWWDFGMSQSKAWLFSILPPLVLFLLGARNITGVVGFTGAVTGGLAGIIIIYLTGRANIKPEKKGSPIKISLSKTVSLILSLVFILGLIYQIFAVSGIIN